MPEMTCDQVRDVAAGYALDIIDLDERQAVLAHIETCPGCRRELVHMQDSADQLLDLEAGWTGEEWQARPVRPARRRFRTAVALAAAALLVFGSTFGSELYQSQAGDRSVTNAAAFVQSGRVVGRVEILTGQPTQIAMSVQGLTAKGKVTCEVITADGVADLGSFQLFKGTGYWITSSGSFAAGATAIRLIDDSGAIVAVASFASSL